MGAQCAVCKGIDDQCNTNEECCGMGHNSEGRGEGRGKREGVCFFGRCRSGVDKGVRGVQCDDRSDCAEDHCCRYFKSFQSNLCEVEPREGERCLWSELDLYTGVVEIQVEDYCPRCHRGLTCNTTTNICEASEELGSI